MNRIVFLDVAKAICMVLVVFWHYMPENSPEWYTIFLKDITPFRMPLFMFASGYLYMATKKQIVYSDYLKNKLLRLLLPYLVVSIIIVSLKLVSQTNLDVDNPVTLLSYVKILYMPEAGFFLWFIWAIWWMLILIPLFKTRMSRLLFFIFALVVHYIPLELTNIFCLDKFKDMLVFFMLGVVAFDYMKVRHFINDFSLSRSIVIIIIYLVFQFVYLQSADSIYFILSRVLPYIGLWFIVEVSKLICNYYKFNKKNVLMQISASTYVIYLFHTTFEGFAKAICRKLPFDSSLTYVFVLEVIVVVGAGVALPIILHKYVLARYEITRLLFGLGKKRKK